uniref:Uncharacterized protein n=1 Tax=Caenorhabditis japonica TaxID=281687 RepID=A0A8R1ECU5_CAEJA
MKQESQNAHRLSRQYQSSQSVKTNIGQDTIDSNVIAQTITDDEDITPILLRRSHESMQHLIHHENRVHLAARNSIKVTTLTDLTGYLTCFSALILIKAIRATPSSTPEQHHGTSRSHVDATINKKQCPKFAEQQPQMHGTDEIPIQVASGPAADRSYWEETERR